MENTFIKTINIKDTKYKIMDIINLTNVFGAECAEFHAHRLLKIEKN